MAALQKLAAAEEPFELWDSSARGAAPDMRCLGVQTPPTLRSARVVRMADMSVREHKAVALACQWQLPRAFDASSTHQHYASLYAHLTPAARRTTRTNSMYRA
jgi:hypothetical protein